MKLQKNKNIILFLVILLSISFVISLGCDESGFLGTGKIYDNFTVVISCPSCSYINFSLRNPANEIILSNVAMTNIGNNYEFVINGTEYLDTVGTYFGSGGDTTSPLGFCLDITMTGNQSSLGTYITIIILTVLSFILLIWVNMKYNADEREKLYKKLVVNYFNLRTGNRQGNLGHAIFYTLIYGILSNLIIFYYLIIVFFLFMVTEMVSAFSIQSLILLSTTILNVTMIVGFFVVMIMFIFNVWELIRSLLADISKTMLGIADDWN